MKKVHFRYAYLAILSICLSVFSNTSANAFEYQDASYESAWNIKQSKDVYKVNASVGQQSAKRQQTAREFIEENDRHKAIIKKSKEQVKEKAKEEELEATENKKDRSLQVTAAYGLMTHKMGEYVVSDGDRISQLDWVNKNTSVFTFGIDWTPFKDFQRLSFSARATMTAWQKTGSYQMNDYDWLYSQYQQYGFPALNNLSGPTEHSRHTKGKFSYYNLDFNARLNFLKLDNLIQGGSLRFHVLLGLKYINSSSQAYGGEYSYALGYDTGTFDNVPGIKYTQRMLLPYYGLAVEYAQGPFSAILTFKNSTLLNSSENQDIHYMRSLLFKEKYKNLMHYDLTLNLGLWINDDFRVFLEGSFYKTKYKLNNGINNMYQQQTGQLLSESGKKTAAMSNSAFTVRVGLTYAFHGLMI
ncbi:MAG: omptin family outer membrane protease [Rickettsiales bacterium]|nr:omptin family outer membrane protease [Rickettsiales bacterium]